ADTPIVPVHVSGAVFGAPIPLLDDPDLIKTDGQGERLARALGAHRAVLMRGHGAVTVGESVEAVFLASLYLEENARHQLFASLLGKPRPYTADRKSTRLNSSHVSISYAVFCLKKKKKTNKHT